jgi:glyoxylase-like metal-dependent hydrolase (beta-lactamase superfamily II)/rhodanese-related sulfurtransferase
MRGKVPRLSHGGIPGGELRRRDVNKQDTVDVRTLREWLEHGEPVTVLDVRTGEERAEWAIPGSVHADAYDPDALRGVELPENGPVVTVCGTGKTSMVAAEQLRSRGVEAVSLEGGMKSWSLAWNTAEVPIEGSEAGVIQVRRTGKGCLSYLIGSAGEAAVIDASLEPEVYVRLAEERNWKISHVLDTHVHADHLSRSRRLAELAGATLHMPAGSPVSYAFSALEDGDVLEVGAARIEALGTPGHTPESTSYLLDGRALFTGDTLFLESVGRPDLGAARQEAERKARALHGSLRRLLGLDSRTLVLPGHASEPIQFDGEPISAPLEEVRENAPLLRGEEEGFVEKVAGRVPPTPENYERIVELNRTGELPEDDPTEIEAGANRCAAG